MIKLVKPIFRKYYQNELVAFMGDILQLFKDANQPNLNALLTTFEATYDTLNANYKLKIKNDKSDLLEIYDERRDRAWKGIRSNLLSYKDHFDDKTIQQAAALVETMDRHGKNIPRLNYPAQTAVINKLLADWNTSTKLIQALADLNLTTWHNELAVANRLFEATYRDRAKEKAATVRIPYKVLKPQMIAAYEPLVKMTEIYSQINPNSVYGTLVKQINEVVKKYNQIIKRRQSA